MATGRKKAISDNQSLGISHSIIRSVASKSKCLLNNFFTQSNNRSQLSLIARDHVGQVDRICSTDMIVDGFFVCLFVFVYFLYTSFT